MCNLLPHSEQQVNPIGMATTPLSSDNAVLATSVTDAHHESTARLGSDAVTGQNAASSPVVLVVDTIAPVAETSVDSGMALDLDPI